MNDAAKLPLPDLAAIKAALPTVVFAFHIWFQTAKRIESGYDYATIFDQSGSSAEDAPPAYIQFRGGDCVEEWPEEKPEGSTAISFPHYATHTARASFVSRTLAEAAWWLWVNWVAQASGDISPAIYDAVFVPLRGAADAGS